MVGTDGARQGLELGTSAVVTRRTGVNFVNSPGEALNTITGVGLHVGLGGRGSVTQVARVAGEALSGAFGGEVSVATLKGSRSARVGAEVASRTRNTRGRQAKAAGGVG